MSLLDNLGGIPIFEQIFEQIFESLSNVKNMQDFLNKFEHLVIM